MTHSIGKEKKVSTSMSKLRPRLSEMKQMTSPVKSFKITLLKRISPIAIGLILAVSGASIGIMSPQIFAVPLPRIPIEAPVVISAATPGDEFNPYVTDESIYNSEMEYAKALQQDAERRFYTNLVRGNERVVEAVYTYATDLNKDLVFALLLGESGGKPDAYNKNINKDTGEVVSIDRGLFQLNSLSYPNLTAEQAYQIETNARYGIAHIRGALRTQNGNVKRALWDYNAGANRCASGTPPKKTILYAEGIIADTKAIKLDREQYIKDNLSKYLMATAVASKG